MPPHERVTLAELTVEQLIGLLNWIRGRVMAELEDRSKLLERVGKRSKSELAAATVLLPVLEAL